MKDKCKDIGKFFLIDNIGNFWGHFKIQPKTNSKNGCQFSYTSNVNACGGYDNRAKVEAMRDELVELNKIAEFDNLSWKVVQANRSDFVDKLKGLKGWEMIDKQFVHSYKDIQAEDVTEHKRTFKEITNPLKVCVKIAV
ncbi:MAG TPA: hypothetical protein VIK86_04685 [Candidatus Paceibacterota bacterium]